MIATLDGGQNVPYLADGGLTKPKCKMVLHPQMTQMHLPT